MQLSAQAVAEQIAQERDAAEREAREKETRVLSLTREIDEMNDKVEELERGRRMLQAELDELANNQGTADKNVSARFEGLAYREPYCVLCVVAKDLPSGLYVGETGRRLLSVEHRFNSWRISRAHGAGFSPKSLSPFSFPPAMYHAPRSVG
jgi:hypothetical protein